LLEGKTRRARSGALRALQDKFFANEGNVKNDSRPAGRAAGEGETRRAPHPHRRSGYGRQGGRGRPRQIRSASAIIAWDFLVGLAPADPKTFFGPRPRPDAARWDLRRGSCHTGLDRPVGPTSRTGTTAARTERWCYRVCRGHAATARCAGIFFFFFSLRSDRAGSQWGVRGRVHCPLGRTGASRQRPHPAAHVSTRGARGRILQQQQASKPPSVPDLVSRSTLHVVRRRRARPFPVEAGGAFQTHTERLEARPRGPGSSAPCGPVRRSWPA